MVGGHSILRVLRLPRQNFRSTEVTGLQQKLSGAGDFLFSAAANLEWRSATLGRERIAVGCDEPAFFGLLAIGIGGSRTSSPEPDALATASVRIVTRSGVSDFVHFSIQRGGVTCAAEDYLIGVRRADCPFHVRETTDGWTVLTKGDSDAPSIIFRGGDVFLPKSSGWETSTIDLIARALFGVHTDSILFHAASVAIRDRGILISGPSRAGKSTTALALTFRGHRFLGDDIAWYVPRSGELLEFRRPVGVREGRRAAALEAAIAGARGTAARWEDSLRIPIDDLVPQQLGGGAPLSAIFFLCGFEERARIVPLRPELRHVLRLQPIPFSLMNVSAAQRLFELSRLFASVRVYDVYPGGPDETAQRIEEVTSDVDDRQ